jgi:hypothetical protein
LAKKSTRRRDKKKRLRKKRAEIAEAKKRILAQLAAGEKARSGPRGGLEKAS